MIQIELLDQGNNTLRLLFRASNKENVFSNEIRIDKDDLIKSVDELFSLLNDINSNNSIRAELFLQFKEEATSFFSILFYKIPKSIDWQKWGYEINLFFDPQLIYIPLEWAFTDNYFLCEKYRISRFPIIENKVIKKNNFTEFPETFCIAGNFSRDKDIEKSIEQELNYIDQLLESEIDIIGPVFGPLESKSNINKLLNSCDIFHYSGHFIDKDKDGWKFNNNELFKTDDIVISKRLPHFIFNNVCGKEISNKNSDFIHFFLKNGVNEIVSPIAPVVSNSASKFSKLFYLFFKKGLSISHALMKARIKYIDENGYSDLTWLQYVHYGKSNLLFRPQKKQKENSPVFKILLILILLSISSIATIQFKHWYSNKFNSINIYISPKYTQYEYIINNNGILNKLPTTINVRNNNEFKIFADGFDTLNIKFSLLDSIFTVSTDSKFVQFIFGNIVEEIINNKEDTLFINLVNNGLCYINFIQSSDMQVELGIGKNNNQINWYPINSNYSMIKFDPFYQESLLLKIIKNKKIKYFKYICNENLCQSNKIQIESILNYQNKCWKYIGF